MAPQDESVPVVPQALGMVVEPGCGMRRCATEPWLAEEEDDSVELPQCRVCYDGADDTPGGKLVAPCNCRGTVKFVHLECLLRWQDSRLDGGATLAAIARCDMCRARYRVSGVDMKSRRLPIVPRARRPFLVGRDPAEVLQSFGKQMRAAPFSTLVSVWKVLVFLTGVWYAVGGGVRGMDQGLRVGLLVVRTVCGWVPYGDAVLSAAKIMFGFTLPLPSTTHWKLWGFVATIGMVAVVEVVLAVLVGCYWGSMLGFVTGAASAVRVTGTLAVRAASLASLLLAGVAKTGSAALGLMLLS